MPRPAEAETPESLERQAAELDAEAEKELEGIPADLIKTNNPSVQKSYKAMKLRERAQQLRRTRGEAAD